MSVTNIIREPFSHEDTAAIVTAVHERLGTTDGLRDVVSAEIKDILEVDQLPERVQSWVRAYCQRIISPDIPMRVFDSKLAMPIDRASLKKRR